MVLRLNDVLNKVRGIPSEAPESRNSETKRKEAQNLDLERKRKEIVRKADEMRRRNGGVNAQEGKLLLYDCTTFGCCDFLLRPFEFNGFMF